MKEIKPTTTKRVKVTTPHGHKNAKDKSEVRRPR